MARLVFGRDQICPRCRKRDRRGNPYGRGWYYWPRRSLDRTMDVIKYTDDDWAMVRCPVCQGTGILKGSPE